LRGLTIAVQGIGGVGYGYQGCGGRARLQVADMRQDLVQRAVAEFDARAVDVAEILEEQVDVLAPCALGAVFNAVTIARLKTRVIAGAANNQLATADDGARLFAADILYAPDYVINAGGLIVNCDILAGVAVLNSGLLVPVLG
jgi:leucine dehydrogenase